MAEPLFEYRRAARVEALCVTLWFIIPLTLLAVVALWWLGTQQNSQPIILAVVIGGTLVIGGMCWYVIQHWWAGGEFLVRVDDTSIQQIVPVGMAGKSFRVLLSEIDHLESVLMDGSRQNVIVRRDGARLELTPNYDSPAAQIARALESRAVAVKWF